MHFDVILEVPHFLAEFETTGDFRQSARSPHPLKNIISSYQQYF